MPTSNRLVSHLAPLLFTSSLLLPTAAPADEPVLVPQIVEPWWQVAGQPDLGEWTSEEQQPVDFGVWQAGDGTWQLWSCMRKTKCGGSTRLFYRWEGKKLTDPNWEPKGIAMTAEPKYGETLGGLQAPHVIVVDGVYYMFYGDWSDICLAQSLPSVGDRRSPTEWAGKTFSRVLNYLGHPQLFTEDTPDEWANARDPMVLPVGETYHCYYTAFPGRKGAVYCRTSRDLKKWSDSKIVAFGGSAGTGPTSAECPHVVYHEESGYYYLLRTQRYGQQAQTSVYRSKDPMDFGIDDDRCLVCRLPVGAPEIIRHEGQWYIASLLPSLAGIRIARLEWRPAPEPAESLFDFDDAAVRARWRLVEGDIDPLFTTSTRQTFAPPYTHFIGTAESAGRPGMADDARTGVIESPEFVLEHPRYVAHVSGGADKETTYVAIVDVATGNELVRLAGRKSNWFEAVALDVRPHVGKKVRIRVVDSATGGWGHINFGGLFVDASTTP